MIKVRVLRNNLKIKEIHIEGHAEFDEFGKDIVCASASSIAITSINACLSLDNNSLVYTENDGSLIIQTKNDNEITNKIIINMINMFKGLESDYPKNIKIRNEDI